MTVLLDGLSDGFADELAASMGETVGIERFRKPYACPVDADAGFGIALFDLDRDPEISSRDEPYGDAGDRRRWLWPVRGLYACRARPISEAGSWLFHRRMSLAWIGIGSSILKMGMGEFLTSPDIRVARQFVRSHAGSTDGQARTLMRWLTSSRS